MRAHVYLLDILNNAFWNSRTLRIYIYMNFSARHLLNSYLWPTRNQKDIFLSLDMSDVENVHTPWKRICDITLSVRSSSVRCHLCSIWSFTDLFSSGLDYTNEYINIQYASTRLQKCILTRSSTLLFRHPTTLMWEWNPGIFCCLKTFSVRYLQ